jgi:hypothetical protein
VLVFLFSQPISQVYDAIMKEAENANLVAFELKDVRPFHLFELSVVCNPPVVGELDEPDEQFLLLAFSEIILPKIECRAGLIRKHQALDLEFRTTEEGMLIFFCQRLPLTEDAATGALVNILLNSIPTGDERQYLA